MKLTLHSPNYLILFASAFLVVAPHAHAIFGVGDIVSDPVVEEATLENNIFNQAKYAWEQTKWAEQLSDLASMLTTVRQQLDTANQVKQAIGDPSAVGSQIENDLFSSSLQNSGIKDTLTDLSGITQQSAKVSATIGELFQPIAISAWTNPSTPFDGITSFHDPTDPLKQYRAVENAFSKFEDLLHQARDKRQTLNDQIAELNSQLKNAPTDAEVQKLTGSLSTAQSALRHLDGMVEDAHHQVELLKELNQNRKEEEEFATELISRERNQSSAQRAAAAEATLSQSNGATGDLPVGF